MQQPPFIPRLIATGFGSGYCPIAPGTMGALLATLIWFGVSYLLPTNLLVWLNIGLILLFTIAGIWATNQVEPFWGEDPARVVVDEMVGVWIALLAAPAGSIGYGIAAFLLFRLLDIFKPLGIRQMERFPRGVGVMMDDILAGIYSMIILMVIKWGIGG